MDDVDQPSVAALKLRELQSKTLSVRHEFDAWSGASERGQELEKFQTRVRAIRNALEAAAMPLECRLTEERPGRVLDLAAGFELAILEIHRVWEFFRAKLALRYVPWLAPYLLAADELAWRCFEPVQRLADVGREPPLVFLSSLSSPFTMPRGTAYRPEEVEGRAMPSQELQQLLESLPIPVIGVPWFALEHLPDALVIAHEVGHDAQQDLALDDSLDDAIHAAVDDESRAQAWLSWRDEVFADVFGALATGPAFAATLIDFVARSPRFIATEQPNPDGWGRYPTAALRVMIVLSVLEQRGFADDAGTLRRRWAGTFSQHASDLFEPDVPALVAAMIATACDALGGEGVAGLELFSPDDQALAVESADDALAGRKPRADDCRILLAAARIAFQRGDPRYAGRDVPGRILRKVREAQAVGVRGTGEKAPPVTARDARDEQAGRRLGLAIVAAHGLSAKFNTDPGGNDVQAQEPD